MGNYLLNDSIPDVPPDRSLIVILARFFLKLLFVSCLIADCCGEDGLLLLEDAPIKNFQRLDENSDGELSLDEFMPSSSDPAVGQRDFSLCDFDQSLGLSRREYAVICDLSQREKRERFPDPFDTLLREAVVALDKSYDDWNIRPNELVNAHTFVANFIGSISYGGKRFVTGRIIKQADLNSDGRMSRAESRQFLMQQLGITWADGPPLRETTGRVLCFDLFLQADVNQDERVSWSEFSSVWTSGSTQQDFGQIDRNQDQSISYTEYADPNAKTFFDPIEWFRNADVDLNAKLDDKELRRATSATRRHLVKSSIPAFDGNHDGSLSLSEFRLSMLANRNYPWHQVPRDTDADGELTYSEFVFHELDLFQLQRSYYFHCLDTNANGRLSRDEFSFHADRPCAIRLLAVDGSKSREIYRDVAFPHCGSVAVSPDGSRILFDRSPPQSEDQSQIVVMDLNGENRRELCSGAGPSWSADATEFACVRNGGKEVWIMEASGQSGQLISGGTAAAWSPDGQQIAFCNDNGLWIHDVERGTQRVIWQRNEHAYRDLGSHITWSPKSDQVALVAGREMVTELVVVPVTSDAKPEVRHQFSRECALELNWTPQNGIVVSIRDRETDRFKMHAIDPVNSSAPTLVSGFSSVREWNSACMTPDRNWYIGVSRD